MKIQEFCDRSGLTKDAVRHYESLGLLNPGRVSAGRRYYRDFSDSDLERIYLIRIGAKSGMRLRQMKPLLDGLMAGKYSFEQQRQIVRSQLEKVEQRIAELQEAKELLNHQFTRIDEREGDR